LQWVAAEAQDGAWGGWLGDREVAYVDRVIDTDGQQYWAADLLDRSGALRPYGFLTLEGTQEWADAMHCVLPLAPPEPGTYLSYRKDGQTGATRGTWMVGIPILPDGPAAQERDIEPEGAC
jgi:hypothetical protein